MEEVLQQLRKAGIRATGPRLAVLAALRQDYSHPAVEEIHRRVKATYPAVSLSTVYETLECLAKAGLCRRVERPGEPARFDAQPDDHLHARCTNCGKIVDLPSDEFPPLPVPAHPVKGFHLKSIRLLYEGICPDCSQLEESS